MANEPTSAQPQPAKAPRWNIVSVALPAVAVVLGLLGILGNGAVILPILVLFLKD